MNTNAPKDNTGKEISVVNGSTMDGTMLKESEKEDRSNEVTVQMVNKAIRLPEDEVTIPEFSIVSGDGNGNLRKRSSWKRMARRNDTGEENCTSSLGKRTLETSNMDIDSLG